MMNAIPALPLSVLAGIARTRGKGEWIGRKWEISLQHQCTEKRQLQSCFPGLICASPSRLLFCLLYTAHLVAAHSPPFPRLNKYSSLSFSLHISQEP